MMSEMKYIVTKDGMGERIYIFPTNVQHSDMAQNVPHGNNIVGAGFVNYGRNGRLECYGRSSSLDVMSRNEEDTELLDRELRGRDPY